jgi:hypothetical protein
MAGNKQDKNNKDREKSVSDLPFA